MWIKVKKYIIILKQRNANTMWITFARIREQISALRLLFTRCTDFPFLPKGQGSVGIRCVSAELYSPAIQHPIGISEVPNT